MPIPYYLQRAEEDEDSIARLGGEDDEDFDLPAFEAPAAPERHAGDAEREQALSSLRELQQQLRQPKALPQDLDDAALQRAQGEDQRQAGLDRASDALYAAGMRQPVQLLNRGPGQADALLQRRALASQEQATERQGLRDQLSLAQTEARLLPKPERGDAGLEEYRRAQAARWQAEADRKAAEAKAKAGNEVEADEQLDIDRKVLGKMLGQDLSGMSRKGIDALMRKLQLDQSRADRLRAREAAARSAKDKAAEKTAKEQEKKSEKAKGFYLEGYELDQSSAPKETEVQKLRDAQANARTMQQTIDELLGLYRKYGTEALPGAAKSRMEALAYDLMLSAKGENMYQLGVLTGPDLDVLAKVVPNPTGGRGSVLDFLSGDQNVLQKLETLKQQVSRRFENAARARGYRRGGAAEARAKLPKAPAGDVDLEAPSGGHGPVVKETKSFRQYADGYIERK